MSPSVSSTPPSAFAPVLASDTARYQALVSVFKVNQISLSKIWIPLLTTSSLSFVGAIVIMIVATHQSKKRGDKWDQVADAMIWVAVIAFFVAVIAAFVSFDRWCSNKFIIGREISRLETEFPDLKKLSQ